MEDNVDDPFGLLPLPDWANAEHWELINLPENIKGCLEPAENSKTLELFIAQLHDKYENNTSEITNQMSVINDEIEERIREQSAILKEELDFLKDTRNENIEKLILFRAQTLSFNDSQFAESKVYCANVLDDGKNKINNFHTFLKDQEKYRSVKYKEILHNGYQNLIKCAYKLPREIQFYFEDQILQINQFLLTNLRNYEELKTNLTAVFVNDIKLSLYKITKFEEDWIELCKESIIKRFEEFNLNQNDAYEFLFKNHKMQDIIKLYNEKLEVLLQTLELQYNPPVTDTNLWFQKAKKTMNNLDESAKQLVSLFQTTAENIFINFFVNSITKVSNRSIISKLDLEDLVKYIIMPPESPIKEVIENTSSEMNILWTQALSELLDILRDRFYFLHELDLIFEKHNHRLCDLKKTTTKMFDKISIEHERILEGKEQIQLNTQIDSVRQEFVFNKLKKGLLDVYKTLDKIKAIMESCKEKELDCVQKYYEYVQKETDVHIAELKCFIEKHATADSKPKPSSLSLLDTHTYLLFREHKICFSEVSELNVWKNEILHQISDIFNTVSNNNLKLVNNWVSDYENRIQEKYDKHLLFHNLRYDRIKQQIANVRLAEINKHEQIFNLHKQAVEEALKKLTADFAAFEKTHQSDIDEFIKDTKKIAENFKELSDYCILSTKFQDVQFIVKKKQSDLSEICEENSTKITAEVTNLLATSFLLEIKLFCEGGNFSAAEANALTKKVKNLDAVIRKRSQPLSTKAQKLFEKFKTQLDSALSQMIDSFSDTFAILKLKYLSDNCLRQVQNEIKFGIFQLKFKKHVIDGIYHNLTKHVKNNNNNFSQTDFVIKGVTELISTCHRFSEYLDKGNSPTKIKSIVKKSMSINSSMPNMLRKQIQSSSKFNKQLPLDEMDLFESRPTDEKKFLPLITAKLNNMFLIIKKLAKEMYQTVNLDKIQHLDVLPCSYTKFMVQLSEKFAYYYYQSLEVWCLQVLDFEETIKKFIKFTTDYCENYLNFMQTTQITLLEQKHEEFLGKVNTVKQYEWNYIQSIHSQLKPLHGYPGNQKLVRDLNEQMIAALKTAYKSFCKSFEPLKELNEICLNKYTDIADKVKKFLEDINKLNSEMNIFFNLVDQVKETTMSATAGQTYGIDFKKYNKIPSSPSETNVSAFIETLGDAFFQEYTIKIQNIEEYTTNLQKEFEKCIDIQIKIWNEDLNKVAALYTLKYV